MPSKDSVAHKEAFLAENDLFTELELDDECKGIGRIEDIDVTENEVWLLQCPKGLDIKELENQKLKIPGRTHISDAEAISVELVDGKEQHAFAYCDRKGRYDLRLLPVRGTIILRNRLKAAEAITTERIEECCPHSKRVPAPSKIRVRHPLLGFQYEDKLVLNKEIADRLQEADEISSQILRDSLVKKISEKPKMSIKKPPTNKAEPIQIDSEEGDDDVQFVSEETAKKKKRKHSESTKTDAGTEKKKKSKKSQKNDMEDVSKELQWLQNI